MVTPPVSGLVVELMRNNESRRTARPPADTQGPGRLDMNVLTVGHQGDQTRYAVVADVGSYRPGDSGPALVGQP
jgi:5-hydroxyisourate hydrolase-like protein (transthyretin family)